MFFVRFNALLENPVFQSARREIEELGFRFSIVPTLDSNPYAIIGGRSNARWWLIPINNNRVAISGLALFQPVIISAHLLKRAAIEISGLGLTGLWARNKIYISSRKSCLADIFGDNNLSYAFFTGTDSPHRKVAIQIMDDKGSIKGFAKVSRKEIIKPLLTHEAKTLNYLHSLNLQTALIPKVLFCGNIAGAQMLVTDTRKTEHSKTQIDLNNKHIAFLRELTEKTTSHNSNVTDWFVEALYQQYEELAERLTEEWQLRLKKAIAVVAGREKNHRSRSLSHGDFTPWNTFFVDGSLYVFDWEYAKWECSPGYDLIHFLLSLPATKKKLFHDTICRIRMLLKEMLLAENDATADILILSYLCGHSLHYSGRKMEVDSPVTTWDGEPEAAALIDILLKGVLPVRVAYSSSFSTIH